jgi:hypothetical protein
VDAARLLPEIFDVDGLLVRVFPITYATGFSYLPQPEKRATPAVVRRVYAAASKYAAVESTPECLICGAPAPLEGRALIAVETAGGEQDLGCICGVCVCQPERARCPSSLKLC